MNRRNCTTNYITTTKQPWSHLVHRLSATSHALDDLSMLPTAAGLCLGLSTGLPRNAGRTCSSPGLTTRHEDTREGALTAGTARSR